MSYRCDNCGHVGGTSRKLSDWELAELRNRANRVIEEWPRMRGLQSVDRAGRGSQLRALADEYGVNVRTLYRYLRKAA
jgi:hypothetical protein